MRQRMTIRLHNSPILNLNPPNLHDSILKEMGLRARAAVQDGLGADADDVVFGDVGCEQCCARADAGAEETERPSEEGCSGEHFCEEGDAEGFVAGSYEFGAPDARGPERPFCGGVAAYEEPFCCRCENEGGESEDCGVLVWSDGGGSDVAYGKSK